MRKIVAWGSASALGAWLVLTGACTTNSLVAKGGACFQSIDCQAGLVCIDANDAGGVCTDDLTGIVSVPEAGMPDAPQPMDAQPDSVVPDVVAKDTSTPDTSPPDTGTPDTGTPDTGGGGDGASE